MLDFHRPSPILAVKVANPLPTIEKSVLMLPAEVVGIHPKHVTAGKMPTLDIELSKASYFGPSIMQLCVVQGKGRYHALPKIEMSKLRSFIFKLSNPCLRGTRVEYICGNPI